MSSAIDPSKPSGPIAYTADVRGNFAVAKSEIEALQAASGGPSTVPPLDYIAPHAATVQPTSGVLIAAGLYTRSLTIQTLPNSTANVWLRPDGSPASPNSGILIQAGGGAHSFGGPGFPIPIDPITAITDGSAAQIVLISGG